MRRWYYEAWLPNTYHAKVEPTLAVWYRGMRYVGSFFESWGFALAPLLLIGLFTLRRQPRRVTVAAVLAIGVTVLVLEGGDAFFGFRFLAPLAPLLALLASWGFERLSQLPRRKIWLGLGAAAVLAHSFHSEGEGAGYTVRTCSQGARGCSNSLVSSRHWTEVTSIWISPSSNSTG